MSWQFQNEPISGGRVRRPSTPAPLRDAALLELVLGSALELAERAGLRVAGGRRDEMRRRLASDQRRER